MVNRIKWGGIYVQKVWWKEAVGYHIYPRSFQDSNGDGIGDIQGILKRLDYLQDLGVDLIYLSPIYESPNRDNGYDISDYKTIMKSFGTMEDFEQLLDEVHHRGMKLIMDLVINHTSDEHPWFIESRISRNSKKRNWYYWCDKPNNWESIFGGSAWEYDEKTDQYYLHIFSKHQPDLNWENKEVRYAIYEIINWWLDKGIDGFRIDAITHIKKRPGLPDMPNPEGKPYVESFDMHMNQEGIHELLQELKEHTYGKYDVLTIGEANGVTSKEAPLWVGEKEGKMNLIFQFEHLGLWDAEKNQSLDLVQLKKVFTRWQKDLENNGWNALFVENHDQPRIVSTWGNDKEYWYESATAIGALYFLMQGTSFIYQGQEIGMTNVRFSKMDDYNDVASKNLYEFKKKEGLSHEKIMEIIWKSSRDNSRTPMQWSSDRNGGFTSGTPWLKVNPNYVHINVENQLHNDDSVLSFYKKMIALKKKKEVLVYGTYDLLLENDKQIFAYTRTLKDDQIVVIVNLSSKSAVFQMEGKTFSSENLLLSNLPVKKHVQAKKIQLKPYEARVYEVI